jgi:hypothetical protein
MTSDSVREGFPEQEGLEQVVEREISEDESITTAAVDVIDDLDVDLDGSAGGLNEYVDPDALNLLFADKFDGDGRVGGQVVLELEEYVLEITDGTIRAFAG